MLFILTDIEGTTTPAAFVYETLFPYFKEHITGFLADQNRVNSLAIPLTSVQATLEAESGIRLYIRELAPTLIAWTEADRKHPALKAIQGVVWRFAYEKGEIKGDLYADVPPALVRWQEAGIGLGVYSSGSVEAQQLLFGHSVSGDLRPYFSHYFDTGVGAKREANSYQTIAETLFLAPAEILFLSDVEAELDAAVAIGMQAVQIIRPGTITGQNHPTAPDFSAIDALFQL